nr:uncharacterized protein LOC111416060 [Onthophagus taurus]
MKINCFIIITFIAVLKLIYGCTISLNTDLGDPQPLILKSNFTNDLVDPFCSPTNRDRIHLNDNETVFVSCPGGYLLVKNVPIWTDHERIVCKRNKFLFYEEKREVLFIDITCNKMPKHTARYTHKNCLKNYDEIEIGFFVKGYFLKITEICFDQKLDKAIYAKHNLTKSISGFQFGFPRPSWIQDKFFKANNVNLLYTRNTQRRTINSLLGLESGSFKYIAQYGDFFLARGHLTPRADYLYGSLQWATFYFVNAAPHWQTFNGANWMFLESDIRRFASRNQRDLVIYTGTFGVLTLPHAQNGREIELYLDVSQKHKIPVPKLFWKIVYEPNSKSGVVFLGVNNPYMKNENVEDYIICKDVCDEINWLTWERKNLTAGYSYCCGVEEFTKIVNFPDFNVLTLLK